MSHKPMVLHVLLHGWFYTLLLHFKSAYSIFTCRLDIPAADQSSVCNIRSKETGSDDKPVTYLTRIRKISSSNLDLPIPLLYSFIPNRVCSHQ
jgi:hypothetical protein